MGDVQQEMNPKVRAYLDRIGYDGPLDGSASVLAELQELHLHTVPYENFDILLKIPLSLEVDEIYRKIVVNRRGGYCFELNALFGWLLRELGYTVTDYMSRFWRDEPNPPPKRRHQVLKVQADGSEYLCDVGVGGIVPRRPLQIAEGVEHQQGDERYRLDRAGDFGWMLHEYKNGEWCRLYSFTEEPQLSKDYIMASFWCEHAPDSIFRNSAMAAVRTREGRNTLSGNEFRKYTANGMESFVPRTEEQYLEALHTYFGIRLDALPILV